MDEKLEKRYGLFTAIAMVVGTVIGSGVFFKAEKILKATGGDLPQGIMSWVIGGIIMVSCAYVFAVLGTRYERVNGLVDYAEAVVGKKYGYFVGWFMTMIYYPTLTSVLAWVSARYTGVLLGYSIVGPEVMTISCFYLILAYGLNALSPVLAGKFQVSSTIIKLIPLGLMAIFGTVSGMRNGVLVQNFTSGVLPGAQVSQNPLFVAVVATAFAYEGWIIATSINAELKDAKRNLPIALVAGTVFVVITYILYYTGLAGAVSNETMMKGGETAAKLAFSNVFTKAGGTVLFVFIVISCLGTLNGLMLGCTRGIYSLAVRSNNPKMEMFKSIEKTTNMPTNSSVVGLLLCGFWLWYFYGANLVKTPWFGKFSFDSSELPIVTIYALYIPVFFKMMVKEKKLSFIKRYLTPCLAIVSCLFMMIAACYSHGMSVVYYLVVFVVVMLLGMFFMDKKQE